MKPHAKRATATDLPLSAIFLSAVSQPQLAQGLQWFLVQVVSKSDLMLNRKKRDILERKCLEINDILAGSSAGHVDSSDEDEDD